MKKSNRTIQKRLHLTAIAGLMIFTAGTASAMKSPITTQRQTAKSLKRQILESEQAAVGKAQQERLEGLQGHHKDLKQKQEVIAIWGGGMGCLGMVACLVSPKLGTPCCVFAAGAMVENARLDQRQEKVHSSILTLKQQMKR